MHLRWWCHWISQRIWFTSPDHPRWLDSWLGHNWSTLLVFGKRGCLTVTQVGGHHLLQIPWAAPRKWDCHSPPRSELRLQMSLRRIARLVHLVEERRWARMAFDRLNQKFVADWSPQPSSDQSSRVSALYLDRHSGHILVILAKITLIWYYQSGHPSMWK